MKRFYTTEEWKKQNQIRCKKRSFSKKHRLATIKKNAIIHKNREEIWVNLPPEFSLVDYAPDFTLFIKNLKNWLVIYKNMTVVLNGRNVTYITADAILVLLSFIRINAPIYNIRFEGRYPLNRECKNIWLTSGFEQYVKNNFPSEMTDNQCKGTIYYSNDKVISDLSGELKRLAIDTFPSEPPKNAFGVYTTLNELMMNTFDHAKGNKDSQERWGLSAYNMDDCLKFSFVDFGVGIFNSKKTTIFTSFKPRYINKNHFLFEAFINGELTAFSGTEQKYRGKGIKKMNDFVKNNKIKRLIFISNDVYANLESDEYVKLEKEFDGTFCYWEFDNECN